MLLHAFHYHQTENQNGDWISKMIENRSLVQILANPYVLWVGVATDQACFNTSHEHSNKLGSEKF